MTLLEIKLKIAKSLNYTFFNEQDGTFALRNSTLNVLYHGYICHTWESVVSFLPDWPKDLNLCREFENRLDDDEFVDYEGELYYVVGKQMSQKSFHPQLLTVTVPNGYIRAVSATALQRCEAYLRMKKLWKE